MVNSGFEKKITFRSLWTGLTASDPVPCALMLTENIIQGRSIGPAQIDLVRRLLTEHPDWQRTGLSRELCTAWNWRNGSGRLKDMACRTLLLKLEKRGLIVLPARRIPPVNAARNRALPWIDHDQTPVAGSLQHRLPLSIITVDQNADERLIFKSLIAQHHYLGLRNTVGENLKYLIRDLHGRLLGALLFGSAAWKTKPRDTFIGWNRETRQANLWRITNNTRFLIPEWIHLRYLASHILSRISRRISTDWEAKYGHPIDLLETFVDRSRFRGTCYQAANWIHVGQTQGRTRNGRRGVPSVPLKDVYVYPLIKNFRQPLCHDYS